MKTRLEELITKNKQEEQLYRAARQAEMQDPKTGENRRNFLKMTALGGLGLSSMVGYSFEDTIAHSTSKVNRASAPSELKITDMRYVVTNVMGGTPIIKIDTNQGIHGLGEVRDAADVRYALFLKSRILGENPCNVEKTLQNHQTVWWPGTAGRWGMCR
jgi:hypothetical protein